HITIFARGRGCHLALHSFPTRRSSDLGPAGRAIGLDMTDEMLELARANARDAGLGNVEFRQGYLEEMPLEDASVDVVISNCETRSEEHTSELQSQSKLVCRLLPEKKK